MKKKRLLFVGVMLLACGSYAAPALADLLLYDWAVNIDGTVSDIGLSLDPVPSGVDTSVFDTGTGLGVLTVTVTEPGDHFVSLFVDHELSQATNTYWNEYGEAVGTPAAGQTWEIDEPGWVFGDIYMNLQDSGPSGSFLDNANAVPAGSENDVSMAIGWNFAIPDLGGGQWAEVVFNLGMTAPGGFYLAQYDPDSAEAVYFSSELDVVPLPGAVLLGALGLGTAGGLVGRFQRRTQK
jgi:hypothetical protein